MPLCTTKAPWAVAGSLVLGLLAACSSAGAPEPEVALAPVEARISPTAGLETITAEEMLAHISYLASDELGGRDTPSPGLEMAAVYIEGGFRDAGLQPAGDGGSFVQRWTFEKTTLRESDTAAGIRSGLATEELEYAVDFFILPSSDEAVSAETVFIGSISRLLGDSPPEAGGRIAIVTTPPAMGMEILQAAKGAAEAGAAGLILILAPEVPAEVIPMVAGQIAGSGLPPQPVPVLGIAWERGERLLQAAGIDPAGYAEDSDPAVLGDVEVSIRAPMDRVTSTPPNVVGLLRGSDPVLADTYIVLSAHFDHVGIGEANAEGDSIYNGADDDASGTSVLLEVAQAFQAMPRAPRRSIVFLAVSGEEKGLLGAAHYAAQPTVPLEGIIANVNLDMVGRNAPDTVIAVGEEFTSLGDMTRSIAASHPQLGLTVAPDPNPSEQAFFRSDHLVFVRQDIPAIFLTTWLHDDYHQPSDEAERIDADKASRVAQLTYLLAWHLAEAADAPTWNEGALDEVHRMLADSPF